MDYQVIDPADWPRAEYFDHYLNAVPCSYSMTVQLELTAIRRVGLKLYPTMLYLLTKTVNRFGQFRMAFRPDGQLVRYHSMHPSYTVFHPETETFSSLWTAYTDDYGAFCRRYADDLHRYGDGAGMFPKPGMPENCFNVSMVPWASFTSFHLHTADHRYLLPIFTLGRFEEHGGKVLLPLAAQVHHSVCDGFHLCRFLDALQQQMNTPPVP